VAGEGSAGAGEQTASPWTLKRFVLGLAAHPLMRLPMSWLEELGDLASLLGQAIYFGVRPPYRFRLLIRAIDFIGMGSVFIVGLTSLFVGMVFGLQLVYGFRQFGAENQTGAVVGLSLARELAPVFSALMVSSRAGSAMTTEIGSMRVTNQIDALVVMSVNPVQYLIWCAWSLPGSLAVPALTMLANIVGITGAYGVCVYLLGLDPGVFIDKVRWYVDSRDVASRASSRRGSSGFVVMLIACRQGFFASGGAAGVGVATTRSVVHSAVTVLVLDYVLSPSSSPSRPSTPDGNHG
jgi:phospholipid/cholesterol/gamma-HCH transport system permease protein